MKLTRVIGFVLLICLPAANGIFAQKASKGTNDVAMGSPAPVILAGTPTCADLNASTDPVFANIVEDWGLRINRTGGTPFDVIESFINGPETQLMGGAGPSPGSRIRLALGGSTLSFLSNRSITAVIVQGGPLGANVYAYNPATFGGFPNLDGSGLTTPGACQFVTQVTFCFQSIAPTAAQASVSGRVTDSLGRGIGAAQLTLSNAQTGATQATQTSSFGYFTFENVTVGAFYVITVSHPRYTFADDTQTFAVEDNVTGVNFIGTR